MVGMQVRRPRSRSLLEAGVAGAGRGKCGRTSGGEGFVLDSKGNRSQGGSEHICGLEEGFCP